MKASTVFRDDMEALAQDFNGLQSDVQATFDTYQRDFLLQNSAKAFYGLSVTRLSSTVVRIGGGRLYADSRQYTQEDNVDLDLSAYLPQAAKRKVAVVVYGAVRDSDPTTRNFLINVDSDEMQPRSIALKKSRVIQVAIVGGTEAPTPVAPFVDSAYLSIAVLTLTTAGLPSQAMIDRVETNEVRDLPDAHDRLNEQDAWRKNLNATLSSIRSSISSLAVQVRNLASQRALIEVAGDVARLKEIADLPDIRSSYAADRFLDALESETTASGYVASTVDGLRMAPAAINVVPLALNDPGDSAVMVTAGGMMLPKHDDVTIVSIGDAKNERDGEIAIANYPTIVFDANQLTLARFRVRYGEEFFTSTSSAWWASGKYDPITGIFTKDGETFEVAQDRGTIGYTQVRLKRYWRDFLSDDEYWAKVGTGVSLTGKMIAQTYQNSGNRWIKAVRLLCTRKGAAGNVTVMVMRCVNGVPDRSQLLGYVTLPYASLVEGDWTTFPIEPVYLRNGDRIAFGVVSVGDHWFQTAAGNDYTQGGLYANYDGDYQVALADRDLCFQVVQARFKATRTVVLLQSWELAGGIASIDILAGSVTPRFQSMRFEYKVGSKWYPLEDPNGGPTQLASLPPLVQVRVIIDHTADIAPALVLAGSQVKLSRPRTALKHVAKTHFLPSGVNTQTVRVQLRVSNYSAGAHSVVAKLLTGATFTTVTAAASVTTGSGGNGQTLLTFVFNLSAAVNFYRVQIEATTTDPLNAPVIDERLNVSF